MTLRFLQTHLTELFLAGVITFAALTRLLNPEIRKQEATYLPKELTYAIIAFEIAAIYFIFFAGPYIKKLYLGSFIVGFCIITPYYLSKHSPQNFFQEVQKLALYTNTVPSIWHHFLLTIIVAYVLFSKR